MQNRVKAVRFRDDKRSLLVNKEIVQDQGQSKVVPFPVSSGIHSKIDAADPGAPSNDEHVHEFSEIPAQTGVEQEMAEPSSREEIAAKLETAEARTEARFAELAGTIDVRFANLDNKLDRLADSVIRLSTEISDARHEITDARYEVRSENRTTRITIIVTTIAGVAAILGVVLAILSVIVSSQSNLLSAFQAGIAAKPFQFQLVPPKQQ